MRIFCTLLLIFASRTFALDETLEADVRQILERARQKYGTPGIVVTLIQKGRITGTFAVGFADRENKKPMTEDTLVQAASLTKLVTAVLVARQADFQRLRLDIPANSYLPEKMRVIANDGRLSTATLTHLLSHHSGLPVSWRGIASAGDKIVPLEEYLSQNLRAAYPVGQKIIYANDAFSLAGYIVAKAEREEFGTHATRVLLKPLQMRDSTFVSPRALKGDKLAKAYGSLMAPGEKGEHNDVTAALPAGGLITSAPEFARFALMLLRGGELDGTRILQRQSVERLFQIEARPYRTARVGFGLGFGINETSTRKFVWWDGGLAGVANRMILHPASRSGVVLLSNQSDNAASSEAANAIFDKIVPPPAQRAYKPSREELSRFAGTYRFYDAVDPRLWFLRYGIDLKVEIQGDTLRYDSRLLRSGLLEPVAPGRFRFADSRIAGMEAFFDSDNFLTLDLSARRIAWYSSLPAILIYAVMVLIIGIYVLYRLLRGIIRSIKGGQTV